MKKSTLLLLALTSTMFACAARDAGNDASESTSSPVVFAGGTQFTVYQNPYGDGRQNPLQDIHGTVNVLTLTAEDVGNSGLAPSTTVTMVVHTPPFTAFASHVHAKPCAPPDKGGGHYQNVVGGATDETNEIHLDFMSNAGGVGYRNVRAPFAVRSGAANSIVFHDATKDAAGKYPKLACVDVAF
jgi:hypothetical protein